MTEKISLLSLMARFLICLSPMYMTESPKVFEFLFDKMFMKWWNECPTKKFLLLQLARKKCHTFLKTVVHHNGEEFSSFSKEHGRLDLFLWKFMDAKLFDDLQHVFTLVLILANGQTQAEWGFSVIKWLIASEKLNFNYFKSNWSGPSIWALFKGWSKIFSQTY